MPENIFRRLWNRVWCASSRNTTAQVSSSTQDNISAESVTSSVVDFHVDGNDARQNTDLRYRSLSVSHTALEMFINHRQLSSVQDLNDGVSSSSSESSESLEPEIENVTSPAEEDSQVQVVDLRQEQVGDLPKSKKFGFRKVAITVVCKMRGSKQNRVRDSSAVGDLKILLFPNAPIEEPVQENVDATDEECDEVESDSDEQE